MTFKVKKGAKKFREMFRMESPKEIRRDIRYYKKRPVTIFWSYKIPEEEKEKRKEGLFKSLEGVGKLMLPKK